MKENKIVGIYKITNIITGEFYIGSSKDIKQRWANHKCLSKWKRHPNVKLYKAMAQYGLDNFIFEVLEKTADLKEREQYWIEQLKPSYNNNRAKGWDTEQYKEAHRRSNKEYYEIHRDEMLSYFKAYRQAHRDECLAKSKAYHQANRDKQLAKMKDYNNRICFYEGETLTLNALSKRFRQQGIANPYKEARKYLITGTDLSAEELSKLALSK